MISFKKTLAAFAMGGVLLLLSAGLFFGALYYLNDISLDISSLKAEVDSEKSLAEATESLSHSLSQNAGSLGQVDSFFIAADQEVNFINEVESLATDSGVKFEISSFTHAPLTTPEKDRFEFVVVQGNAHGNLQNVYKFLRVMERYPKISQIGTAELTSAEINEKKEREWKLSFSIKVVKFK